MINDKNYKYKNMVKFKSVCKNCGKDDAMYDDSNKRFICCHCARTEKVIAGKQTCFKCKNVYEEFTWFDPSGCKDCNVSFIE
jgi:hypothetical protein